jgi:hypothetical protein
MADQDLLGIQEPNIPSFLDIARAAQPQMSPESPSPFAGLMYGQDKARYNALLEKATYMAQLRKKMDEQKAKEFSDAGPGRSAEIALRNRLANTDLESGDALVNARRTTNESAQPEALAKASDAQKKLLVSYGVDNWSEAKPATKRLVYQQAQNAHMAFANQPFDEFDDYMTHIEEARKNEPNIYSKLYTADQRVNAAAVTGKSRVDVANIHADMAKKIADSKPKNMSEDQYMTSLEKEVVDGTATKQQIDMLNTIYARKQYANLAKTASIKGDFNIPGMPTRSTPAIPSPVQVPVPEEGAAPPQASPKAAVLSVQLPPKAIIQLNAAGPGKPVTFTNGQTWMLDPQTKQPRRLDGGR